MIALYDSNAIMTTVTGISRCLMGNLVVRNINDEVIKALKARAGKHGVSAEAEHRRILELVLLHPGKKSFAEVLRSMPNVGADSDFERVEDNRDTDVFS